LHLDASLLPAPQLSRQGTGVKPRTRTLILISLAFSASVALTVFAVPLYNLMCETLGITRPTIALGQVGTTLGEVKLTPQQAARRVTIRFTANTQAGLPIDFAPLTYSVQVGLGQPFLTAYAAKNNAPKALDGVAVHMLYAMGGPGGVNVADYIALEQCFCFAQQHYPAREDIRLPLSFTLSPDLPAGIHTITFAYTLFEALPDDPRVKKSYSAIPAPAAMPARI
jgi:cytochrome c oxidase assembly protein subunit 11